MTVQVVLELQSKQAAQAIQNAIDQYKARLQASIERTRRRLSEFEQRYNVTTNEFILNMTAEDLEGGDLEYVEWAGEAKILESLEAELGELSDARAQLR